jgi:hypothetical protein
MEMCLAAKALALRTGGSRMKLLQFVRRISPISERLTIDVFQVRRLYRRCNRGEQAELRRRSIYSTLYRRIGH